MPKARRLALFVALSLLAAGLPGGAPLVLAAGPTVTVDVSLGNGIATGAVVDPDPGHALVTATNNYHFWAGLDLQPPSGAATLAPAPLGRDARGIYGLLGLVGPGASSAWAGTFGPAGGSQAVWIHYDLATTRGAQALALTCLTIVADTFGAPLLAPSAAAVEHAVTLITDLGSFTDLLSAVQRNDPWAIAQQWSLLLQSTAGRAAIIAALAALGVLATDAGLQALGTVVGLIDFAQTLYDLLRAGVGGHTSGQVTFSAAAADIGAASATPRVSATAAASARLGNVHLEGTFNRTGSMKAAQPGPTATLLNDGRVLVAGGCGHGPTPLRSAELYDPVRGSFEVIPQMVKAHCAAAAVRLADGRVLIVGGDSYANRQNTPIQPVDLYDSSRGTFSSTGSLIDPRSSAEMALLPDETVLVLDGESTGYRSTTAAEVYQPRDGAFAHVGALITARSGAAIASLPDGSVLVAGGATFTDVVVWLQTAEIYDPNTGSFRPTSDLPQAADGIGSVLLGDGKILLAGGRIASTVITGAELYDPQSGVFTPTGSLQTGRTSGWAIPLSTGDALIVGGYDGNVNSVDSMELYNATSGDFVQSISLPRTDLEAVVLLSVNRLLLLYPDGSAYIYSFKIVKS